jgi:hypothetical protein
MPSMFRARTLIALACALPFAGLPAPPAAEGAVATELASAVGVSRTRVRVRFVDAVRSGDITPADLVLTMGGEARAISAVDVDAAGKTAEVEAGPAWAYGTAGAIRLRTGSQPAVRVWAAPGDVTRPVMRGVKLSRSTVCIVGVSRNCSFSGGTVSYTVDEAATIVLDLRRRSTDAPSLMKVTRGEGAGRVRFKEKIEGRRLRPGLFRLTVYAVDAAGNESRPVTLHLRVRH